ncbi:hypothetical protein EJ02DRAFT_421705 [Clathrospora elynae]|uniref:Rhodopsin domain-containing protein n=1 Tax=Clathrospora elynae TaxID=706981 RepID=A0A6A5SQJ0_9PLEO|nr:hypothetical protein EJ02DRAFT_421705 [Clathrospora elynae]
MTIPVAIQNAKHIGVLITSSMSILIATVSVGLRLIAKCIGNRIDYSDYCIVAALLWNTALHACAMVLVTHGGFGLHVMEIYQRFGPDKATFFKGLMSFAMLWNATVCFSKLSVLLMYTALIPTPSMIKWARSIGALIVSWEICNIITALLICRPLAKIWDFKLLGTCGSQPDFYFAMGLINLITDAMIIILPMPYLYRLRLAWGKKLLAMFLLSIGVATWTITIYRQILLPRLNCADMTHRGVLATILSGIEPALEIALACIPLMRPLFKTRPRTNDGSGYQYSSSRRTSLFSKKGSRSEN